MLPSLSLLVIRTHHFAKSYQFYSTLGLHFQQEQHKDGPIHWAAMVGEFVFEIYSADDGEKVSKSTRLGWTVENLDEVVLKVAEQDALIVLHPIDGPWGRRAVVEDPDGRHVELYDASPE